MSRFDCGIRRWHAGLLMVGSKQMAGDEIKDAQEAVIRAIAELRAANVAVPQSLHKAAHALSYAVAPDKPMPACNGQGHAGAI
jgi:hypothetical protein